MSKDYRLLEIEVLSFDEEDVIATSVCETQLCPQEGEHIHCNDYF